LQNRGLSKGKVCKKKSEVKTKRIKIYGFGTAAVDFRITVPDLGINYKEKLLANEVNIIGGGSVANCLVQVSRLGGKSYWLGKLGCDWISDRILEDFKKEGVNCSRVIRDTSLCSPFNVAIYYVKNYKRVGGYLLPNSLNYITKDDIIRFTNNFKKGDWAIVEIGEVNLKHILNFCEVAKDKGVKLVVDVDLDPIKQCGGNIKIIKKIFEKADFLVPNKFAMKSIYPNIINPKDLVRNLIQEFKVTTIVTAGSDGVYYSDVNGPIKKQEIFKLKVVDTIGAGDAFHGGLIFALAKNKRLSDAIKIGSKCAAANCRIRGTRSGMLNFEELNKKDFIL